jgi:hypothetical protein
MAIPKIPQKQKRAGGILTSGFTEFVIGEIFSRTLVGGIPTPLKHMKVSWDDYPILWKLKSMAMTKWNR